MTSARTTLHVASLIDEEQPLQTEAQSFSGGRFPATTSQNMSAALLTPTCNTAKLFLPWLLLPLFLVVYKVEDACGEASLPSAPTAWQSVRSQAGTTIDHSFTCSCCRRRRPRRCCHGRRCTVLLLLRLLLRECRALCAGREAVRRARRIVALVAFDVSW